MRLYGARLGEEGETQVCVLWEIWDETQMRCKGEQRRRKYASVRSALRGRGGDAIMRLYGSPKIDPFDCFGRDAICRDFREYISERHPALRHPVLPDRESGSAT